MIKKIFIYTLIFVSFFIVLLINKSELKKVDKIYFDSFLYNNYQKLSYLRFKLNVFEYYQYYSEINKTKKALNNFKFKYSWLSSQYDKFYFIGHRGGNAFLNGENTFETIKESLNNYDLIEIDVFMTNDDKIILYHQHILDNKDIYYSKDIERAILTRGWTPTYLQDVLPLLEKKKYFILDIKSDFKKTINKIREDYPEYSKYLIPQIYNYDQVVLYDFTKFASPIFTSYRSEISTNNIFKISKDLGLKVITLTKSRVEEINLPHNDIKIFTHAVDDYDEATYYKSIGVNGIYTKIFYEDNFTNLNRN